MCAKTTASSSLMAWNSASALLASESRSDRSSTRAWDERCSGRPSCRYSTLRSPPRPVLPDHS
ncbi:Uncharacterised protein [Bordetella pertussis]|nr:Uncharacterised protein [Bordetella pertussis]CFP68477.1 Uncharacterised protein [Bordetella pertussis]CFW35255.1 Uncharacterised protein [Bordetella pertussis]